MRLSEEKARQLGYASSSEYQRIDKGIWRVFDDEHAAAGLDGTDYQFISDVLASPNQGARYSLVLNFKTVVGSDRKRRLIEYLKGRPVPEDERSAWLSVFQNWLGARSGPSMAQYLLSCRNSDFQDIAKEALNEIQTASKNKT